MEERRQTGHCVCSLFVVVTRVHTSEELDIFPTFHPPSPKAFFRSLFRSKSARLTTTTTSEYYNMSSSPSLFCCRTASSSSKSKSSFPIKASKCSVQAVFRSRSRSNSRHHEEESKQEPGVRRVVAAVVIIVIILTPRRGVSKTRGILGVGMPREEKSF